MFLYDDDGSRWECDEADCEADEDGTGFWLLTEDGEDEDFYAYCEDEGDE